jgi:hypothetical protein
MGRRLAEATKARFTRRTRGEAGFLRFAVLVFFLAVGDFFALAGGVLRVGEPVCALPRSGETRDTKRENAINVANKLRNGTPT